MSNPQTIWNLSLALGCSVGAWWMKFGSGVSDDSKTIQKPSNRRDADLVRDLLPFCVPGGPFDHVGASMKEQNGATDGANPPTNVVEVDFAYHRLVRDMRKRAADLGIGNSGKVK